MTDATRLNKFLASCGIGSRRSCDALVQEGHVEINGKVCLNPAARVSECDFVKVDGKRAQPKSTIALILHKPRGLVCSKDDELGRETIYGLLHPTLHHLHHVGRLDRDSEGLLVLTNDGDLSQRLLHPSRKIEKEYLVTSSRPVTNEHIAQFLRGIFTDEGRLAATDVERVSPRRLRMVLVSGHKRQLRVMFQTLGYHVERLVRLRIGSLLLGDLAPGTTRPLGPSDIALLQKNPTPKRNSGTHTRRSSLTKRPTAKAGAPPHRSSGKSAKNTPKGPGHHSPRKRSGPPPARRANSTNKRRH